MKIYQLHEYSGEWEDFRDRIIGSYLRKERAEEEKVKAEEKERLLLERGRKCNNCPFFSCENAFADINDLIEKYSYYCQESKLEETDYGVDCQNYYQHWDEATFEIVEVEIEE